MTRESRKRNRKFGSRIEQEVEKIVYKIMTNDGLEDTVARAIQKALIDLIKRYFLLIIFLVVLALAFQSFLIVTILKNH